MKIGILRHFKVDYKPTKLMNSKDFVKYVKDYDVANVIKNEIVLDNTKWDKCYCSDLKRAKVTAESIHDSIVYTELLREVTMYPIKDINIKLPSFFWSISSRIAWKSNNISQKETLNDTKIRVKKFIEELDLNKNENILIVSHGFFLITLINEFKELGFKGDIPKRMKNGYLYILEK